MKHDTEPSIPKEVITYAAGSIEARLAEIARNTNQPESELREWVAIFLLSSWTGIIDYMPTLRGKATKTNSAARKMEMANNSHFKSQKKPSNSQNKMTTNKKGFKYNGTHWTQQPKNKARLKKQAKARYAATLGPYVAAKKKSA